MRAWIHFLCSPLMLITMFYTSPGILVLMRSFNYRINITAPFSLILALALFLSTVPAFSGVLTSPCHWASGACTKYKRAPNQGAVSPPPDGLLLFPSLYRFHIVTLRYLAGISADSKTFSSPLLGRRYFKIIYI